MVADLWPSIFCTTLTSAPAAIARLAAVCRTLRREAERPDRRDLPALAPHLRRAAGARRADPRRLALRPQAGRPADARPAPRGRPYPSTLAHRTTGGHRHRRGPGAPQLRPHRPGRALGR